MEVSMSKVIFRVTVEKCPRCGTIPKRYDGKYYYCAECGLPIREFKDFKLAQKPNSKD
jgi:ribosomal protein L37E